MQTYMTYSWMKGIMYNCISLSGSKVQTWVAIKRKLKSRIANWVFGLEENHPMVRTAKQVCFVESAFSWLHVESPLNFQRVQYIQLSTSVPGFIFAAFVHSCAAVIGDFCHQFYLCTCFSLCMPELLQDIYKPGGLWRKGHSKDSRVQCGRWKSEWSLVSLLCTAHSKCILDDCWYRLSLLPVFQLMSIMLTRLYLLTGAISYRGAAHRTGRWVQVMGCYEVKVHNLSYNRCCDHYASACRRTCL